MSSDQMITCIVCPLGCKILVNIDGDHVHIRGGNKCKRGMDYARTEALDPRRMLTTSMLVQGGEWPLVSVKSTRPVPKNKIFEVLHDVKQRQVRAPVRVGDILIENVADTGIAIIATKTVKKK